MSAAFHIGRRPIGRSVRPFVIAEMSGNHNQSLDRALAIVEAAAKAGATTPMGAQAEAMYALFDRLGFGGKDFSAVLQLLRGRLGDLS